MRGSWFVVALAASAASGCSQWPRSANLGEDPNYVAAGDVVTVPVTYSVEEDEADELVDEEDLDAWPDEPFAAPRVTAPAFGVAHLYHGTLASGGWTNIGGDLSTCGPVPPGFYDGDSDGLLLLELDTESHICVRGRLDTTEDVGWDVSLIQILNSGCDGPVLAAGTEKAVGSGLTRPDAVWGVTVPPGEYAVLIGAYQPSTVDLNVPYTVGISVWAPFAGDARQCPLLEAAP